MAPTKIGESGGKMIYSATYSGVPVYEFVVDNNQVMRRRQDDWINATHILKVANFDKPARTRILEREVQKGHHEKIQGGYGKYQGTWVPLDYGRHVAEKYGALDKLRPLFDFVHHDRDKTPPQAPKHTTAASTKPRLPKAALPRKIPKTKATTAMRRDDFFEMSSQINDEESRENSTVISESMLDEDEIALQRSRGESRKRKRGSSVEYMTQSEYEHKNWAEALLDYFMLHDGNAPYTTRPPTPPNPFDVDRVIDNQGHTALHWAAAMGDVDTVKDLINHGAHLDVRNIRGETPLIRSAIFANCYEKGTMGKITSLLQATILIPDRFEGTVLHHICHAASSCSKTQRARHYLDVMFTQLSEITSPQDFAHFINKQDTQGDTAFHVAVRHSRRCTRAFQGIGAASDIENDAGITVNHVLRERIKKLDRTHDLLSSSPIPSDALPSSQLEIPKRLNGFSSFSTPTNLHTESARALSESFGQIETQVFDILQAIEGESKEKDTALTDAKALVQNSNDERHLLAKQTYELAAELEDSDDQDLRSSLAGLRAEALALEELTQHGNLHADIRQAENMAIQTAAAAGGTHSGENTQTNGILSPPRSGDSPTEHKASGGGGASGDYSLAQHKVRTALALAQNQGLRRQLTLEVVDAKADAGFTERGDQLMRLVAKVLGKENAVVMGTVDEILEELEFRGAVEVGVGGED